MTPGKDYLDLLALSRACSKEYSFYNLPELIGNDCFQPSQVSLVSKLYSLAHLGKNISKVLYWWRYRV